LILRLIRGRPAPLKPCSRYSIYLPT